MIDMFSTIFFFTWKYRTYYTKDVIFTNDNPSIDSLWLLTLL